MSHSKFDNIEHNLQYIQFNFRINFNVSILNSIWNAFVNINYNRLYFNVIIHAFKASCTNIIIKRVVKIYALNQKFKDKPIGLAGFCIIIKLICSIKTGPNIV